MGNPSQRGIALSTKCDEDPPSLRDLPAGHRLTSDGASTRRHEGSHESHLSVLLIQRCHPLSPPSRHGLALLPARDASGRRPRILGHLHRHVVPVAPSAQCLNSQTTLDHCGPCRGAGRTLNPCDYIGNVTMQRKFEHRQGCIPSAPIDISQAVPVGLPHINRRERLHASVTGSRHDWAVRYRSKRKALRCHLLMASPQPIPR